MVHVNLEAGNTQRSLDLVGANFPIKTALHEVNIEAAQIERDAVISKVATKVRSARLALQFMESQIGTSFADIKKALETVLSNEEYASLEIDGINDLNLARGQLADKIDKYEANIARAEREFQQTVQDAIIRVRESYERQDEELKLSLKAIKNSGLGRLGMDWIVRELMAGQLMPEIGVSFDTGNFNPAKNNFGEPPAESGNGSIHLAYIYRLANKAISGDPTQPFTLSPGLLRSGRPHPIANSESAAQILLENAGLVGGAGMVDKELVRKRLSAPLKTQNRS